MIKKIFGIFSKNKIKEKDKKLLELYEQGKYLRINENVDNVEIIKNGTNEFKSE